MSTRRFRVLPKQQQSELFKLYGNLDGFAHGQLNDRITEDVTVSYFDHWLDESEFHLLDLVSEKEHLYRRQAFESFYRDLAESYNLYSYRIYGKKGSKIQFRSFVSEDVMHEYFNSANSKMSKDTYPKLIVPECNTVIQEGYDYCLYLGFNDKSDISFILNLAAKNGLHVLESRDNQG